MKPGGMIVVLGVIAGFFIYLQHATEQIETDRVRKTKVEAAWNAL